MYTLPFILLQSFLAVIIIKVLYNLRFKRIILPFPQEKLQLKDVYPPLLTSKEVIDNLENSLREEIKSKESFQNQVNSLSFDLVQKNLKIRSLLYSLEEKEEKIRELSYLDSTLQDSYECILIELLCNEFNFHYEKRSHRIILYSSCIEINKNFIVDKEEFKAELKKQLKFNYLFRGLDSITILDVNEGASFFISAIFEKP